MTKTLFLCTHCDAQYPKWLGRCEMCDKWGTVVEGDPRIATATTSTRTKGAPQKTDTIKDLKTQLAKTTRLKTGDEEIDRVFGGGIVPGSVNLLSGEPGIGKSTLVANLAGSVSGTVLYIGGEESGTQLASRFERLGISGETIVFVESTTIEAAVATIEQLAPTLVIVDSVQTCRADSIDSQAGSPNTVRFAAAALTDVAKRLSVPVILIGQVTKDGSVAGPKTLEHLVDVVLNLEGDTTHAYRLLRASKNRFGATGEVGVFEMTEAGMKSIANPSEVFLSERAMVAGSVITSVSEGSRTFLVEVQALVEKTSYGTPIRRASGFDQNRLQLLVAIVGKRANIKLADDDVYINVIGGMNLREPAADLAVCAAIISAKRDQALPATLYLGEVGLGGEVRSVPRVAERVREAKRLGISNIIIPTKSKKIDGTQTIGHIKEL